MSINRREFLQHTGVTVALSAVGVTIGCDALIPLSARLTDINSYVGPLPAGVPILVMIELGGGNDILNTHIPYAVSGVTGLYLHDRPNLAIKTVTSTFPYTAPPAGNYQPPGLDLDGHYALHGNLVWLANRWKTKGDVAIVQGVGENVVAERSHFAASAYRWAAAFSGPNLNSGWLGRYNDIQNQNQPVASVSVNGMHQSLVGAQTPVLSVSSVAAFNWSINSIVPTRPLFLTDLKGMGDPNLPAALNKVARGGVAIKGTTDAIGVVQATAQPSYNTGVAQGTLAYQLSQVAMMITGSLPCQTYVATLGNFDFHGGQAYNQWVQLGAMDQALQRFFSFIDGSSRANDVFVLITSEFGRQVKENAGLGTDHGRASSAILIGGGVRGGLYGQMPSLAVRDFDALIPTVDFRSVFATLLNRLSGDANVTKAVLGQDEMGNDFADLGIFTGAAAAQPDMTGTGPSPDLKASGDMSAQPADMSAQPGDMAAPPRHEPDLLIMPAPDMGQSSPPDMMRI